MSIPVRLDSRTSCTRYRDGQWGSKQSFVNTGAQEFPRLAADSQGTIHMVWMEGFAGLRDIGYATFRDGAWDHWEKTQNNTYFVEVSLDERSVFARPAVDENDTLHVVFAKHKGQAVSGDAEIFYAKKPLDGNWSAPTRITYQNYAYLNYYPDVAARDGKQYAIWEKHGSGIFVSEHSDGGSWSSPVKIVGLKWPRIEVDSGGGRHALAGLIGYLYQRRLPGAGWINYGNLNSESTFKGAVDLEVDAFDNVYAVFMQGPEDLFLYGYDYNMGRLVLARMGSRELPPDPQLETLWKRDGAFVKAPMMVADNNGGLHVVFYDASFMPGEVWRIGEEQTLTWEATAPAGKPAVEIVQVDYSLDSGATWNMLYDAVPNTGSATGEIPRELVSPSTHCRFRITDPASGFSDKSDGDFTLLPPLAESGGTFVKDNLWGTSSSGTLGWYLGKFNNDGKSDLLKVSPKNYHKVLKSTGSEFVLLGSWATAQTGLYGWFPGDFNGDGLTDLARSVDRFDVDETQVFISTGSEFVKSKQWAFVNVGAEGYTIGDFDGDGIDDILVYDIVSKAYFVLISTGSTFNDPSEWFSGHTGIDGLYPGDFDGDGKTDLMRVVDNLGTQVLLSTGSSFVKNGVWTEAIPSSSGWFVGDFNGDGRSDIMQSLPNLTGADVFLSSGSAFEYDGSWTDKEMKGDDWLIGDFNGDGSDDLLRFLPERNSLIVFLSNNLATASSNHFIEAGEKENVYHKVLKVGVDTSRPTLTVESEANLLRPWLERIRAGEEGNYFFQIKTEYEKRLGRKVRDVVIYRMLYRHLSSSSLK